MSCSNCGARSPPQSQASAWHVPQTAQIKIAHLRRAVDILRAAWLIGIGDFAEKRARLLLAEFAVKVGKILHPSPASPAANKDWARKAADELKALGIWR